MAYVIDVQGFKTAVNEFVYKEVAVIPLQEDAIPSVFLFKPPHPWKQLLTKNKCENRWLEQNYHGILWRSGRVPYEEVSKTIRTIVGDRKLYVKGFEKAKWLKRIFVDEAVCNIEDLGCPSLKNLPVEFTSCTNHTEYIYSTCALRNAVAMKKWLLDNKLNLNHEENVNLMYI